MPFVPSSFLLLVEGQEPLVACLLLVAMSFGPRSFLLVVGPGAPSSVLAPSRDALVPSSFLLLVVMPFVPGHFLLLVEGPGAPSSVLAPSSDALCS